MLLNTFWFKCTAASIYVFGVILRVSDLALPKILWNKVHVPLDVFMVTGMKKKAWLFISKYMCDYLTIFKSLPD